MAKQEATMQSQRTYTRFNVLQRIEHIALIASFSTLAVTGLVQKFAGNPIAEGIIRALGGIEHVRTFHHIAAIVFVLECIYHFILLAHKVFVRRVEMTMLPGLKDAVDAIDLVRYNLGLTNEHPRMPRYNFAEKAEYWALIWGAVVMGITGFMLWNPIALAKVSRDN
jgi:cytochrome b subunit of formate dehydrogenase